MDGPVKKEQCDLENLLTVIKREVVDDSFPDIIIGNGDKNPSRKREIIHESPQISASNHYITTPGSNSEQLHSGVKTEQCDVEKLLTVIKREVVDDSFPDIIIGNGDKNPSRQGEIIHESPQISASNQYITTPGSNSEQLHSGEKTEQCDLEKLLTVIKREVVDDSFPDIIIGNGDKNPSRQGEIIHESPQISASNQYITTPGSNSEQLHSGVKTEQCDLEKLLTVIKREIVDDSFPDIIIGNGDKNLSRKGEITHESPQMSASNQYITIPGSSSEQSYSEVNIPDTVKVEVTNQNPVYNPEQYLSSLAAESSCKDIKPTLDVPTSTEEPVTSLSQSLFFLQSTLPNRNLDNAALVDSKGSISVKSEGEEPELVISDVDRQSRTVTVDSKSGLMGSNSELSEGELRDINDRDLIDQSELSEGEVPDVNETFHGRNQNDVNEGPGLSEGVSQDISDRVDGGKRTDVNDPVDSGANGKASVSCPGVELPTVQTTKVYDQTHKQTRTRKKNYTCDICHKSFSQSSHLQKHERVHTGEKLYKCNSCNKSFAQMSSLREHLQRHTGETPHACNTCSKAFVYLSALRRHECTHTEQKPHPCSICYKTFSQLSNLRRHERSHTEGKPYACSTCRETFSKNADLQTHECMHSEQKPYTCDICNKSLSTKYGLQIHKYTHAGVKSFKCRVCFKAYSQPSYLRKHERAHTEEKPYACTICAKSFLRLCDVRRHELIHTGEKSYTCSVCGKKFLQLSTLKTHELTHTREKPHTCSICGKGFSLLGALRTHEKTHTGEKPYTCSICDKVFTQLGALQAHRRTHTGEKPYVCTVCKKAFTQLGGLQTHKRTHTGEKPYTCSICKKAFTQRGALQTHQRTHTGEKPFTCSICNKAFTQRGALNSHQLTHAGEKPYTCSVCNKAFTQRGALKIHQNRHKGKTLGQKKKMSCSDKPSQA